MFIVDVLLVLLLLAITALAITVVVAAWLSMPLADAVNMMLRRIGLTGPGRGSRSIGGHGIGLVDEEFRMMPGGDRAEGKLFVKGELWNARCAPAVASTLRRGDEVEFVYNEDLTLTVIEKTRPGGNA